MGSIFHRLCGFASSRSTDASAAQQIVSGDAFSDEASTRAGAPDLSERNRVPSAVSTVGELNLGTTARLPEGAGAQGSIVPVNAVAPRQLLTELPQLYVDFVQLQFIELIGRGSFKTVYRGRWANTAVAIVGMRKGGLVNEARILHRLSNHPNVIQFFRWTSDDAGNEYMIVELAKWGSLDKMLSARGATLPTSVKLMICEQICSAMCELAEQRVLHRDLAARNILVLSMDPVHVKVTDFGLARLLTPGEAAPAGNTSNGTVPIRSTPPEVLLSGRWSEKSDVWSYGITLWEIMSNGAEPYASKTDAEVVKAVVQGELLPRPSKCPKDLYSLMLLCWARAPEERPSFSDIARTFREWRDAYLVARAGALPRIPVQNGRSSSSSSNIPTEMGVQSGQTRQLSPLRSAAGPYTTQAVHSISERAGSATPSTADVSPLQRAAVAAAANGLAGGPGCGRREGGQEAMMAAVGSRPGTGTPVGGPGLPFAQEGQPSTQHDSFLTEGYVSNSNSSRIPTPGANYTMPALARRVSALQTSPAGAKAISAAAGGSWHGPTAEAARAAAEAKDLEAIKARADPSGSGEGRSPILSPIADQEMDEAEPVQQDPNMASPVQGLATGAPALQHTANHRPLQLENSWQAAGRSGGLSPGAPRSVPALMLHTAVSPPGPPHLLYPPQQQQSPASAPTSQSHAPGSSVDELVGGMAGGSARGMPRSSRHSCSSGSSGARRRAVGVSLSESGSTSQATPTSQQDLLINTGDHLDQSEVQQMLEHHQPTSSGSASVRAQAHACRGGDTPTRVYASTAQHVMLNVGRMTFRSSGGSREVGMESGMTMETANMSFDVEPILDPQSIVITQDHLTTNQAGLLGSVQTPRGWDRLRGQTSGDGVPSPTALMMPAALQQGGGLLLQHVRGSGRPPSGHSSSPRLAASTPSAASTSAASLPLVGRPPAPPAFSTPSASTIPGPGFLSGERPRLAAAKLTAETLLPVLRQAEVGGVAAAAAAMMEAGARESLARTSGVENISFQLPVLPHQSQTGDEAAPLVPSLPALSGFVTMGELSAQPGFGGQLRPLPPPGAAPAQPFFNLGLTEFAASVRSQPQPSTTPGPSGNSGYMSVRAAVEIAHAHQHSGQYRKSQ